MVFAPTDTARLGGLARRLTSGSSFTSFDRRDREGTLTAPFEQQARRFQARIAIRSARAELATSAVAVGIDGVCEGKATKTLAETKLMEYLRRGYVRVEHGDIR